MILYHLHQEAQWEPYIKYEMEEKEPEQPADEKKETKSTASKKKKKKIVTWMNKLGGIFE